MDRELLDRWSPVLAMAGALIGGVLTFPLFFVVCPDSRTYCGDNYWLIVFYFMPIFPALAAFFAAWCIHKSPSGWPFVRAGAALGAYVGWLPAWMTYETLRYLEYAPTSRIPMAVIPLALSPVLAWVIAWSQHRLVPREAVSSRRIPRMGLFVWVLTYHVLATVFVATAIPQVYNMQSYHDFTPLWLPYVALPFGWGSLYWFRSALTLDDLRSRRGIQAGIGLHAIPLLLVVVFSWYVATTFLLRGTFTYHTWWGEGHDDPTLLVTPFLGVGMAGLAVLILLRYGLGLVLRRSAAG